MYLPRVHVVYREPNIRKEHILVLLQGPVLDLRSVAWRGRCKTQDSEDMFGTEVRSVEGYIMNA